MILASVHEAANILRNGGVVAYPTESCYGLGCNPDDHNAVRRILQIKRRRKSKGLIIIADNISRFRRYLRTLPIERRDEILKTWPGPYTWVVPARQGVSSWLRGSHRSIAVRITKHPDARALCRAAGMAIVSTSANRARRHSLKSAIAVCREFSDEIDGIVRGTVGFAASPSVIRDGLTGEHLRI